jgi:MFS family permease
MEVLWTSCPGIILSYSILLSILANIPNLASVLSIFFLVPKIDVIGRKGTALHLKSCLGLLASIAFIFSKLFLSIELFILGSFLLGLIDPIRSATVKIYIAECAPSCYRGMLINKKGYS